MSYDARIESLRSKKASLEKALEAESKRPYPDSGALADMKRQKLRIKDELERYAS